MKAVCPVLLYALTLAASPAYAQGAQDFRAEEDAARRAQGDALTHDQGR
jgi:hypothetical protein